MVYSEHTPVEQKLYKKQENDQWRLLINHLFCLQWGSLYRSPETSDYELSSWDLKSGQARILNGQKGVSLQIVQILNGS